jgi:hypothetical protein
LAFIGWRLAMQTETQDEALHGELKLNQDPAQNKLPH